MGAPKALRTRVYFHRYRLSCDEWRRWVSSWNLPNDVSRSSFQCPFAGVCEFTSVHCHPRNIERKPAGQIDHKHLPSFFSRRVREKLMRLLELIFFRLQTITFFPILAGDLFLGNGWLLLYLIKVMRTICDYLNQPSGNAAWARQQNKRR